MASKKRKFGHKLQTLHDWYISKGWKADQLPQAYKLIRGGEMHGAFIAMGHPAMDIPLRDDVGRVLDYGHIPRNTWAGEHYEAPAAIPQGTKKHPWYSRIRMDLIHAD